MSLESSIASLNEAVQVLTTTIRETQKLTVQSQPPAPQAASAAGPSPTAQDKPVAATPAAPATDVIAALRKEAKEITVAYAEKDHEGAVALLKKHGAERARDLAEAVLPTFIAAAKASLVDLAKTALA